MKRSPRPLAVVLAFASLAATLAFSQADRYAPPDGSFSYVPPPGWVIREAMGMKYPLAFGPPAAGFAPNIVVIGEAHAGSLEQYASASMASFLQLTPGASVGDMVEFVTDGGATALKVEAAAEHAGVGALHHLFYIFDAGATKFTVTCSRPAGDNEELDRLFDAAMRTFETGA